MKPIYFVLLLFAIQFTACNAPEYPEFVEMQNVKFKSVGFLNGLNVTCTADAVFNNPNAVGANVTEVNLDVSIDGKKVTTIKQEVSAKMPANSAFTLPLDFDIPLREVLKDVKPSLSNILKNRKLNYQIDGTLKVGLGAVEVAIPVDYAGEEEVKL
ncbi:MAG: LEA type 2 family protein [Saprospiraceae bacterium]